MEAIENDYKGNKQMTENELIKIKHLLEALARKCKTDALYVWTKEGIAIVERELDNANYEPERIEQIKE